jgi:hypothetical protein
MTYQPGFTWPIAFATWAVIGGLAWAAGRRRRRRKPAAPAPARMSRPPVPHGEASDRPPFDSIYQISPHPDGEGGENK